MMRWLPATIAAVTANAKIFTKFARHSAAVRRGADAPFSASLNGITYATPTEACCACFKEKYQWPDNSGMPTTTENGHTCNTCYISDRYGIEGPKDTTFEASMTGGCPGAAPATASSSGKSAGWGSFTRTCMEICDVYLDSCAGTWKTNGEITKRKVFEGPGACERMVTDTEMLQRYGAKQSLCELEYPFAMLCPTACAKWDCGAPPPPASDMEAATESAIKTNYESIHEWNWNCAEGKAPTDMDSWLNGPVEGEPPARGAYLMCNEAHEWYCKSKTGKDWTKTPSDKEPQQLDEESCAESFGSTVLLPDIDFDRVR